MLYSMELFVEINPTRRFLNGDLIFLLSTNNNFFRTLRNLHSALIIITLAAVCAPDRRGVDSSNMGSFVE